MLTDKKDIQPGAPGNTGAVANKGTIKCGWSAMDRCTCGHL